MIMEDTFVTNDAKDAMVAFLFRVQAKFGKREELLNFWMWNKTESLLERGTVRFDVFQDPQNQDAFYVYEAYENAAAFDAHKKHEPYQIWISVEFRRDVVLYDFNLQA